MLGERLAELRAAAVRLRERAPAVRDELHAGLERRLQELLGGASVDGSRLAQEVALLVDRSDVVEELDRLEAHLVHFAELIAERRRRSASGSTSSPRKSCASSTPWASKCRDAEMTRAVLDAKVLCEQLREQVQNVE